MQMNKIKQLLSKITGKSNIYFTKRGNISIKEALRYCKSQKYNKVLIQDQGGWITYRQFAEKLKLEVKEITTDYGLISGNFTNSILLINSMPAYAFLQDTSNIKTKNCIIINDISGSIGRLPSRWGDIIIGSFGKAKPINLEKGGFIAVDFQLDIKEEQFNDKEKELLKQKLEGISRRIESLDRINRRIKQELSSKDIIHPEYEGINVIIRTPNQKEKQQIIRYCEQNNYEYTECPRYIRVNDDGISIEVKRL
jgi:hypothetical protein